MLNHFVHSYALTIAWTSETQVQPEVYLLVQHQVHLLVHLYVYKYWSSPLGATPGVLSGAPWIASSSAIQMLSSFFRSHSHLYSQFLIDQILHPFAPLSLFSSILKSILKCVPYTLSFAISVTSWESYLWLCCVVPSRLLTTLSKMFTPTHVSSIVLELHYMLALSKGQLHFEIIQVSYVLR